MPVDNLSPHRLKDNNKDKTLSQEANSDPAGKSLAIVSVAGLVVVISLIIIIIAKVINKSTEKFFKSYFGK